MAVEIPRVKDGEGFTAYRRHARVTPLMQSPFTILHFLQKTQGSLGLQRVRVQRPFREFCGQNFILHADKNSGITV